MVATLKPRLVPDPDCPRCNGEGLWLDFDRGEGGRCDCPREPVEDILGCAPNTGLPLFAPCLTVGDFSIPFEVLGRHHLDWEGREYLLESSKRHEWGSRGWLAHSASPGAGKTTSLAAILAEHRRHAPDSMRARNVPAWLGAMKDSFDSDDKRFVGREIAECSTCAILFLDDIGVADSSEWCQGKLYDVLNYRATVGLPVWATSNLPPRALGQRIGERQASRLAKVSIPMAFPEVDLRVRHAKALGGAR